MDAVTKNTIRLHRENTKESWDAMRARFFSEWADAVEIMRRQDCLERRQWSSLDVNEFFFDHAHRMTDERWWELRDGYAG